MIVSLADLLVALCSLGLTLRRVEGNRIEVVGDANSLAPEIKAALTEHKPDLARLVAPPRRGYSLG